MHVVTEFHYHGPVVSPAPRTSSWKPSVKQARKIQCQAQVCHEVCSAENGGQRGKIRLMEVFSPPRFRENGYDLSTAVDPRRANHAPDLLVLSPPCTDEGGWFHLNASKLERWEYLKLKAQSRSFIRWCCKLFMGGRAVFEHPTGARTIPKCRLFVGNTLQFVFKCAGMVCSCPKVRD